MKPDNPIVYNEFYLDAMTGGSPELPAPVTTEQHYLAHLAGMTVTLPQPIILRDMFLAKICGMDVDVPTYIPGKFPRKFAYYAKAAGQDVDVPQPITREEMYWADYVSTPSEKEYTGAVPVTFVADGTPLLDLLISGNEEHSGTPTPDNPIMPEGTGERTGNLFLSNWEQGAVDSSGVDIPSANGVRTKNYIPVTPSTIYSISRNIATSYINLRFYNSNKQYINNGTSSNIRLISGNSAGNPMAAGMGFCCFEIIDTNIKYMRINDNSNDTSTKYMMVEGQYTASTMPSYEPWGIKIPISSANTTTPVYLGETQSTRRIKKWVLKGDEDGWLYSSGFVYNQNITPDYLRSLAQTVLCSHFKAIPNVTAGGKVGDGECALYSTIGVQRLYFRDSNYTTSAADFKTYLQQQYAAGTPVTVWYVLANEETAVVNEPLMKIGDYADTVSKEQAGVQIPTERGTNTLDVLTDVKPSEIYIKYKG